MAGEEIEKESRDLIFSEIKDRLNFQCSSIDALDTKTSIVLGFIGVILGVLYSSDTAYNMVSLSGLSLILFSLVLSILAFRTEGYRRDPEPRPFRDDYLSKTENEVRQQLMENWIESFESNKKKISRKAKFINIALILLFLGLVLMFLGNYIVVLKSIICS
ncbi:MAG: hypothetical protein ABH834_00865 [Candidatus Altiarchaeota archaeon]